MDEPLPTYLTVDEVAKMLRASSSSIGNWSRHGCRVAGQRIRLTCYAAGCRYLYKPADVDKFVADCTAAREAAPGGYAGDRPPPAPVDDGYEEMRAELSRPIRTRR